MTCCLQRRTKREKLERRASPRYNDRYVEKDRGERREEGGRRIE
jgi:hypothetical protein